jgi:hypothetical protein
LLVRLALIFVVSITDAIVTPGGNKTANLFWVVPVTKVKVFTPGVLKLVEGSPVAYVLLPDPSDGVVIRVAVGPQKLLYLEVTIKFELLILPGEVPVSLAIPFHD